MAAGATYEPIASTTLSSAASSITFSSISSAYTDLRLVFVGTGTASSNCQVNFNSDTTSTYSQTALYGTGAAAGSSRNSDTAFYLTYYTNLSTTIPTLRTMDIFSYAGSTKKTCLTTENSDLNGSGSVVRTAGLWPVTSAITSIVLSNPSSTFAVGTTATLYGILKA
jgi:hypothetical protein